MVADRTNQRASAAVTAVLRCAPETELVAYTANVTETPQMLASCHVPSKALMESCENEQGGGARRQLQSHRMLLHGGSKLVS